MSEAGKTILSLVDQLSDIREVENLRKELVARKALLIERQALLIAKPVNLSEVFLVVKGF